MRATRHLVTLLTASGLALGLALVAGCTNPFTPASPEKPNASAIVEDFTTPAGVLNTIALGVMARGVNGRSAYTDSFADSTSPSTPAFYAFHDPAVTDAYVIKSGSQPPDWTLYYERRFYDYLSIVAPSTYTYTFAWAPDNNSPSDQIDLTAGTALLHRYYVLEASSSTVNAVYAVGYADLYLQKVNGRWVLYRWQDRVDPTVGVQPADGTGFSIGYRRLDSLSSSGSG